MLDQTAIFNDARQQQAFGTTKLRELLNICRNERDAIYRASIIPLIEKTIVFRDLADPGPFFANLRNSLYSEDQSYLESQMQELVTTIVQTKPQAEDSRVAAALAYCLASIMNRLKDLEPNDCIMQVYQRGIYHA